MTTVSCGQWRLEFDDVASLFVFGSDLPQSGMVPETVERPFLVELDSWRPRQDGTPWEPIRQALLEPSATHPESIRSLMIVGHLTFQAKDLERLGKATKEVVSRRPDCSQSKLLLGLMEGLAAP